MGSTRGSPSILRHPSSVGASGRARGHRAGLSSPPCRSPPRQPRRHPAPGEIWEPGGDQEGKSGSSLGHRGHPNHALKFGARCYLCFLDHFAKGPEKIPGQVPAEPPCRDTRVRDTSSPQPPHGTGPKASPPWGISATRDSLNPSQGGPKFLGLTIGSPHDGDKHQSGHEDVEQREPPAEEQQVEDVPKRHRGPYRRGGGEKQAGWGQFSPTPPPPSQIRAPKPPTSVATDDVEVGVELLDDLRAVLPRPRRHVALPLLEAELQKGIF